MNDRETADLQDQVTAMQGILDKHLDLIGQLRDVVQVQSTVLQEHLKMHKENTNE
jgi:hypothetical protein